MVSRKRRHTYGMSSISWARYALQEVPLGCAPQEVPLGYAPQEVPLGYAPQEVPLGYAPQEVPLGYDAVDRFFTLPSTVCCLFLWPI